MDAIRWILLVPAIIATHIVGSVSGAVACTIATVLVAPARVKAAIYIPLLIVVSWDLSSIGSIFLSGGIGTFAVRVLADILGWAAVFSLVWIAQVRSDSASKPQAIHDSLT